MSSFAGHFQNDSVVEGSAVEQYHATLMRCSCPDFTNKGRKCKLIYRLEMELGIINIDDMSVFNKQLAKEIDFTAEIGKNYDWW